jgi:hypothetical protein
LRGASDRVGTGRRRQRSGSRWEWVSITGYWFRARIFGGATPQDSTAATCLAYYRGQLVMRRDHLRNAWIWLGPLGLGCILLAATLAGKSLPGEKQIVNIAVLRCVCDLGGLGDLAAARRGQRDSA